MYLSTNTRSVLTYPIETIFIVPPTPTIKPYLKKSDLNDTKKYIHTDMKAYHEKTDTNIKCMNYHIAYILATPIDTIVKKNKQDEKITELSSKLSNYEDRLEKITNKETQIKPLALQVKQYQYEKITDLSSKISTYEYRQENMINKETQLQPL